MNLHSRFSAPAAQRRSHQRGSALLVALGILAVTSIAVGSALMESRNRFRTSHQSGRWTQAAHAAEAGVELALLSAQKDSWTADGWPSAPGAPGAAAVAMTFPLSAGVPATGPVSANVAVDTITLAGAPWLRIRSTGQADLSGGAVAGQDAQDVLLRKLSLRQDRTTGASVGATPRATRTVEILAEPVARSPFKRSVLLDQKFTMSGGWVDSYDSSDTAKSTGGLYDVAKRQSNGDVGINDTQGASNLGSVPLYGDVSYSGTAPTNTSGVTGTIAGTFNEPVAPVLAPTWSTFNATPAVISSSVTLTGSTQAAPARYKVSAVAISAGQVLTLSPHTAGAESYIEVWVTGNFDTTGGGAIIQEAGVHVTYHVEGDVTVSSSTFDNQTNTPAKNILNVINPAVGVPQKVDVTGSGTFIGAINAPGADFTVTGSGSLSGAFIGKTMTISGGVNVHYDEALARASIGPADTYRVASWVEAVR